MIRHLLKLVWARKRANALLIVEIFFSFLVVFAVVTLAVSMIVSSLYPRFRDLGIIWTVFSTALFYGTPVIYALGHVTKHIQGIVLLQQRIMSEDPAERWLGMAREPIVVG